jgi:hypothetical protein
MLSSTYKLSLQLHADSRSSISFLFQSLLLTRLVYVQRDKALQYAYIYKKKVAKAKSENNTACTL